MANEYAVNAADLTTVADAIRIKSGTTDPLEFPNGFVSAIGAIAAGGAASGLDYDAGEWGIESDTNGNVTIPHNLGDVPDFVCIWTDRWAGITEAPYSDYTTLVGWIWMRGMTGMTERVSSSANVTNPLCILLTIQKSDYRISVGAPSSAAYGITDNRLPDSNNIYAAYAGANAYWRAGVTYKYFVSKAWWTVGGGADA